MPAKRVPCRLLFVRSFFLIHDLLTVIECVPYAGLQTSIIYELLVPARNLESKESDNKQVHHSGKCSRVAKKMSCERAPTGRSDRVVRKAQKTRCPRGA